MCGITGIAAFSPEFRPRDSQLRAMVETLIHRGPDDRGSVIADGVGLGMRRLSIIDLAGGHQPLANEDGTVVTVLNGEIYNYRELRQRLRGTGHEFSTQSDTETIVHAYEEYGADFPQHLNGMFALALHDRRRQRLLLVRDPLGIKPLYYYFCKDYLVWGSEIKALLASGLITPELHIDALGEFLSWEYLPGTSTLLQGVRKLAPGTLLDIDLREPACRPRVYWDVVPAAAPERLSDREWEERVDEQIKIAVRRQLISDVPLGAFLSGGVDSSLIVAAMRHTETFSIGFDDASYSELPWARRVAEHLGVNHVQEVIQPQVAELFDHLLHYLDDPIGDFSVFPTFLVSRLARQYVTVVLSGDGGDELFGGYETYVAQQLAQQYRRVPTLLRQKLVEPVFHQLRPRPVKKGLINTAKRFLEGLQHSPQLAHARWRIFLGEALREQLFTPEARRQLQTPAGGHIEDLFRQAADFEPVTRGLYVDLKSYLCENILTKVDRMSMAVSLEARVPFLDVDLVKLAFQVPDHLKVRRRRTKVLLKRVAARHVPRECVYRPKQGFSIPLKNWLATQFRPLMEMHLERRKIAAEGIFQAEVVERLKSDHLAGRANHSHILWGLIVFQAWRKKWLKG